MLPFSYNQDRCLIFPVDPGSLYAYWDYSEESWQDMDQNNVNLILQMERQDGEVFTIQVRRESRSYWFKDLSPSTFYRLVLLTVDSQGEKKVFLKSSPVRMPPNQVSTHTEASFKTFSLEEPLPELPAGRENGYVYNPSWRAELLEARSKGHIEPEDDWRTPDELMKLSEAQGVDREPKSIFYSEQTGTDLFVNAASSGRLPRLPEKE